jgi:hypothetical protein
MTIGIDVGRWLRFAAVLHGRFQACRVAENNQPVASNAIAHHK